MKFVFDKRPDMTINFNDHMGGYHERRGQAVSMEVSGTDDIELHFATLDERRSSWTNSTPTGGTVDVYVTLDEKMASLLASWIISRLNHDDSDRQRLEFKSRERNEVNKLPLSIDV